MTEQKKVSEAFAIFFLLGLDIWLVWLCVAFNQLAKIDWAIDELTIIPALKEPEI